MATFLQNARHFNIDTLNASTTVFNPPPPITDPIAVLHAVRAVEATHTSKTAAYASKCKPGTRVKVTHDIVSWVVVGGTVIVTDGAWKVKRMLWLQGPAGGGKTCIMREVANQLSSAGLLAATYFFSIRVEGLSSETPFMATIVHQLLGTIPWLRAAILKALEENPGIFDESLETQMNRLILKPIAEHRHLNPRSKYAIVVDGFDECVVTERGHLLRVLHTLSLSTPFFLIIIASRPELDLRTIFHEQAFRNTTHFLCLQDYDGTPEIRSYLCDEFCRIRDTHPTKGLIPASWPVEGVLTTLVDKSSGNYIIPSTVIKYVDNPRRNPVALLEDVTGLFSIPPKVPATNPLAQLDELYTMILHPPEGDVPLIRRILHCIIGVKPPGIKRTTQFYDQLLGLTPGTTEIAICDLHSILAVNSNSYISFHHATLHDFLTSEVRSGDLFQPTYQTELDLTTLCARRLEMWYMDPSTSCDANDYAASRWMEHLEFVVDEHSKRNWTLNYIPQSVLQFDARLIWRYQLIWVFQSHGSHDYITLKPPQGTINRLVPRLSRLCGYQNSLVQSLLKMGFCQNTVEAYCRVKGGRPVDEEWNAKTISSRLQDFEADSGLGSTSSLGTRLPSAFDPFVFITRQNMQAPTDHSIYKTG